MPISFECSICGKRLKAKDEHVGRRTKCPSCQTVLEIPAAIEQAPIDPDLGDGLPYDLAPGTEPVYRSSYPTPPSSESSGSVFHSSWKEPSRAVTTGRSSSFREEETDWSRRDRDSFAFQGGGDDSSSGSTSLREYLYCVLVLTLIPLMISLLEKDPDIEARIQQTVDNATPEQRAKILPLLENEKVEKDQLLAAMPDGKLHGAHLAFDSQTHWVYGLISAVFFLGLMAVLFERESVNPLKLMGVGLFTGTVGIVLLLICQFCSSLRFGRVPLGRGAIIFLILILIGWSYNSALDPDSNFFLSAVGFTVGVGLCEEVCKALPLIALFHSGTKIGWRGACLMGLASGVGFGVSEGIMYSGDKYNGIMGFDIYLVRFVSCVALHAMWAGSVGMTIYRGRDQVEHADDFASFGLLALRVVAVPMVLHGLYDTLLKKDFNFMALLVAVLSFAWFAYQIETSRGFDRVRKRKPAFA